MTLHDESMSRRPAPRWLPLDNAAKIYPAARSKNWSNIFRLSATLTEPVDRAVLQSALDATVGRFPSICARLRRGFFWYYLEQVEQAPRIREEYSYPLVKMYPWEVRRCAFRVIVYRDRIALEFFHALTDGNGALIFLKTLLAEYLHRKYGIAVPAEQGVLDRTEPPSPGELEDSFQKYAGPRSASRRADDAYRITGTLETGGFQHITCLELPVDQVLRKAREYGVSLTAFLCAATMMAIQDIQQIRVPNRRRQRPVKVLLPVDLRRLFPSTSVRNFVLFTTPQIDPRLGAYTFREICDAVRHHMGLEVQPKYMGAMIAANVAGERILALRAVPLFLKNLVMKAVFHQVGERKSSLSLSNLGAVTMPAAMTPYVKRLDFILGVQATAPYNCGVITWGDTLYMNVIRNIREPELEYHLCRVLKDLGLTPLVRSN